VNAQDIHVLLVEDNPGDVCLIEALLSEPCAEGIRLAGFADRLATALELLDRTYFGLVLLDLSLPDSQRLDTFHAVRRRQPRIPIVVLTGLDDETVAAQAVVAGAQDYLVKGVVTSPSLARSLRYAVLRHQSQQGAEAHGAKPGLDDDVTVIRVERLEPDGAAPAPPG
jgi:CheY-like chemotaxis protein